MPFLQIENRAISTLLTGITNVATTWVLAAGEGSKFPSSGDFHVTCEDEIVTVTNRAVDTLTVTRAAESTTAVAHAAGRKVQLRITKGIIEQCQAPRTATLVVAASDASALSMNQADYLCDGTADDEMFQAAINALPV